MATNTSCNLFLGQDSKSSKQRSSKQTLPIKRLLSGLVAVYALICAWSYWRASPERPSQELIGWASTRRSEADMHRIAILSVSTPDRVQMYQPATNSKTCYSAKHGYTFIMDTNEAGSSLNPWWRKVTALQKYLPYYDWILFMDGDTLITNYTVRLEWFLPTADQLDIDLIVTDHNIALNNGVFFLRNSAWSTKFLSDWIETGKQVHDRGQRWAWDDQGGFYELLVRLAYERPGAPSYNGECSDSNHCCEYGALQRCYNQNLESVGAVYGDRNVPHVKYIDPRFYPVPSTGSGWIRGGFDQYRKAEFRGQTWIYGEWTEDNFWQPGDFVLHSYEKSEMAQFVPATFADSCLGVDQMELPPNANT